MKRKNLFQMFGIWLLLALLTVVPILFTMGTPAELVGMAKGTDYYESCDCENVNIDAESTNVSEIRSNLFDIEQVEEPVIRTLVGVPNDVEHNYLVVKVEWLTEDDRTIKQQRKLVRVSNDKVQIIDIEREEKMEYAPKMRVEPMGWTNNKLSNKIWEPSN